MDIFENRFFGLEAVIWARFEFLRLESILGSDSSESIFNSKLKFSVQSRIWAQNWCFGSSIGFWAQIWSFWVFSLRSAFYGLWLYFLGTESIFVLWIEFWVQSRILRYELILRLKLAILATESISGTESIFWLIIGFWVRLSHVTSAVNRDFDSSPPPPRVTNVTFSYSGLRSKTFPSSTGKMSWRFPIHF